MLVLHHATYSINSLCHFFGRKRFETGDESRNLAWLAPLYARRSVAQQPSRLPDLGRAWPGPLGARHLGDRDRRAGKGPGSPGRSCASSPERQKRQACRRGCDERRARHARTARDRLRSVLPDRPFSPRAVGRQQSAARPDGAGGLTFRVRSPRALGHVLRAPGQLGLGRAYVSGEIEVDDIDAVLEMLDGYTVPPLGTRAARLAWRQPRCGQVRCASIPTGARHPSCARAAGATAASAIAARSRTTTTSPTSSSSLMLGESMTYSCAIFSRGARTLEEAQRAKLEMVCTKLELRAGERVLDVGCGWGSFALHAAREHGVHVIGDHAVRAAGGAARASARARRAGRSDRDPRRRLPRSGRRAVRRDRLDRHGRARWRRQHRCLRATARRSSAPGGRLLNHGIARLRHGDPEAGPFSERFVFPDAAPLHVSRVLVAIEATGLEPTHIESFRPDYVRTLREWARNLDQHAERAEALIGPERMRVWRLYVRAARRGFDNGFTSIFQILAHRPTQRRRSSLSGSSRRSHSIKPNREPGSGSYTSACGAGAQTQGFSGAQRAIDRARDLLT